MTHDAKLKLAREAAASIRPYSHNSALILDGERDGTDVVQAALAAIEATEARIVEPSSEEIQAWIKAAYREPEMVTQIDDARFTRWNMEVAYLSGLSNAAIQSGAHHKVSEGGRSEQVNTEAGDALD